MDASVDASVSASVAASVDASVTASVSSAITTPGAITVDAATTAAHNNAVIKFFLLILYSLLLSPCLHFLSFTAKQKPFYCQANGSTDISDDFTHKHQPVYHTFPRYGEAFFIFKKKDTVFPQLQALIFWLHFLSFDAKIWDEFCLWEGTYVYVF